MVGIPCLLGRLGFRVRTQMALYGGYIRVLWGIMENKMETIGIVGYIFPKLGVPFTPIVENQMEKKMENEMETEVIQKWNPPI